MDADLWQRVNELFQATIERESEERSAFLARACHGDDELRRRVARLIRAHERSGDFLGTPAAVNALRVLASARESSAVPPPLTSYRAGAQFRGTERFTVLRQLGAGGMGVVYEVHDRTRNEVVALKTLLHARPADIYRLKREFRSLADFGHPNLVSLYELILDEANCFFTMELVNGVNLVEYVRRAAAPSAPPGPGRIRHVVRQLVNGVNELHRMGKLHRDLKPSNILVTSEGRVVILDFGLTSDVFINDAAGGESMAGTPAYFAPERHAGVAPAESDDWYSVGVTLYEALTGRLPCDGGSVEEMRRRRGESDPRPPAEIAADVPEDLNAICMGLLRRDPAQRLSGGEAVQRLERDSSAGADAAPSEADVDRTFVGRRRHLDALDSALSAARHGFATAVYLHGPSGIGKSALVQCFLDQALHSERIVVLRGRCYEHESVPYKALDGVIDSLSQYLGSLPRSQAAPLIPPDVAALSRLFPVMLRVESAASGLPVEREHTEPLVVRQRAFEALRELLTRIAARQPLVVYIDDLHWADADSAVLLGELLRPPQAPPILTIACARSEEIAAKPFLQSLLEHVGPNADVILPLEPMTEAEARALIVSVIPAETLVKEAEIQEIAHEAGGNPFLLRQLAGHVAFSRASRGRGTTFAEMMAERVGALPDGAQRFLQTLAICGRPMAPELVYAASSLDGDERPLVAQLRSGHFLRGSGSARRVELYHDRIRETLAGMVSSEDKRRIHGVIARTLVARGAIDPEALYEHYREAGDGEEASAQAVLAAKKADAALAFDRAAVYYQAALELAPGSVAHPLWKEALAAALANAGRPGSAADAFLVAARAAPSTRRVELLRLAAEQFLIGGHIDRGTEIIRMVLQAVRIRLPPGPRTTLAALIRRRVQLRWRGLGFVERSAERVPAAQLLRVDTCWSVATGFTLVDDIRAAHFHTRHLLLALDAGEPHRIARALAFDIGIEGTAGGPRRNRVVECTKRAERLAARVGDPYAIALCALSQGVSALLAGEWPTARDCCDRARNIFRDQCVGTTGELNCAREFALGALLFQGELREVSRELPSLLAAARERGNLYFETELRTRMNLVWLAADDPDEGERQANDAMERWSHAGFHRQHYNHALARIQTELYRGRAAAAWDVIAKNWTAIEHTLLLRIQFVRIEAWNLRARCALLMAATGADARRFLSVARNDARRIARERMPWSDPVSLLLNAAVAYLEGQPSVAAKRLTAAADGFERAHMQLYAAVARRRLSQLASDHLTQARRGQADEWMAAQGIVSPSHMTRLIAPGFGDGPESTEVRPRSAS